VGAQDCQAGGGDVSIAAGEHLQTARSARTIAMMEVLMSDIPQHESHRRPHSPPMAASFLEFDLQAEVHRLQAETTWSTGQNARTLIKYDDFRVVLTALKAHIRVPEHKTEGRISVHVLSGHIQLTALGRTFSLRTGGLLALDQGVPHHIVALEESAFLLTIAWPGTGQLPNESESDPKSGT